MKGGRIAWRRVRWLLCGLLLSGAVGAVELVLPDLQGRDVRLSDYRGDWVLVNFWATWCGPCVEELPLLESLHRQADVGVRVIGINMEAQEPALITAFLQQLGITYPNLLAPPDEPTVLGRVEGLPLSLLIDPTGQVVARHAGAFDAPMLRRWLQRHQRTGTGGTTSSVPVERGE